MLLNGDTTWQAYNIFGGYSLYVGPNGAYATRARAVTFDRPYGGNEGGQGDSEFQANLLPLLSLVERRGLPAEYLSDTDLHADPHCLDGALAVLSLGRDEYYSVEMRDRLTAATAVRILHFSEPTRSTGTSVSVLPQSAPTSCRPATRSRVRSRFTGTTTCLSPANGVTSPIHGRKACSPECSMSPTRSMPTWSSATRPLALRGIRGGGWYAPARPRRRRVRPVNLSVPTPRPVEVLARSPLVCDGVSSHSDMAYSTTPSGAGVLATGTNWWIRALAGAKGPILPQGHQRRHHQHAACFRARPAGHRHPAVDNLAALGT